MKTTLFDADGQDCDVTGHEPDPTSLGDGRLLWIDLGREAAVAVQLLPLPIRNTVEALSTATQAQFYDEACGFSVELAAAHHAKSGTSCVFIAKDNWMVTICDDRPALFDDYLRGDRGAGLKGRMSALSLAASLISIFNEATRTELATIENQADNLDEEILRARERRSLLLTLATLRRRTSYLRQIVAGQRAAVLSLSRADTLAQIADADHEPLRQLRADYERLSDEVTRVRETIIGSFELYTARVAHDANRLLKALTIATVITGVVGAVAGIFGMNFDTPISHSGLTGFHIVTWSMIGISVAVAAVAVWRRWF
ncbi:MAG: hypothetical protein B7Y45_00795 [Sphingomonas sp. 28-66-16]|nr:MAG: hypothetical protein B7Y45_00795 [Sphingomonas sp. 28-66-16]